MDMAENYTIAYEGDHIRATTRAEKSIAWARKFWGDTVEACHQHSCYDVLGVSYSLTPMPFLDAYEHIQLFRDLGIDSKYRIAWVELNPQAVEIVRYVGDALFNRGLPGEVFSTEEAARAWLLGGGKRQ